MQSLQDQAEIGNERCMKKKGEEAKEKKDGVKVTGKDECKEMEETGRQESVYRGRTCAMDGHQVGRGSLQGRNGKE